GGMAEIFKAKTAGAEGFEKDIVIKRILPHFTEDEAFVKMFIDEATITSKLQHSNIVQIFDFDVSEGSYYIAMEYIEGVDLKKVIDDGVKGGKPLSVAQCVWVTMEIAKGLHYAHVKDHKGKPLNIVHRDISPHNVMLSYNAEVKLMDFGIAKAAQRSTKTMAGTVKGKVAYMSPEQARGKPLDGRSDLFALAIMLWEMLTHKRLFLGDSDFETLTAVLKSEAPPPSSINPDVPPDLDAIVLKALEKDRDKRHPTVEAFNRDLTRWYYSNVTDLDKEALKPYMQELFAADIAELHSLTAEEKNLPRPGGGGASHYAPEPQQQADRTVALPVDYDPQQAATLLDDGSISQAQIRQALAKQTASSGQFKAAPVGTGTYNQQAFTGTYNGEVPEKKGKGWLIAIIAILVLAGGGVAAYFALGDKGTTTGNNGATTAPSGDNGSTGEKPEETAELVIKVDPPETVVKVNGAPKEGKATGLKVGDKVSVEASAPGYEPFEDLVEVTKASQPLEIVLKKKVEQVSLVIEAVGDEKAIIKVNGKVLGLSPQSFKGNKDESYEVEVTPSAGGDPVKRTVKLDGATPVFKVEVAGPATEVKLVVKLDPPGSTVTVTKGTVSYSADSSQAIIGGLALDDSITVNATKAGYEDESKAVKVTSDGQEVSLELKKKSAGGGATTSPGTSPGTAPAPGGKGTAQINAKPWAQVTVDGKPYGTTPRSIELPAGKHTIKLCKSADCTTKVVTISSGKTSTVTHDFSN
ncbi:MAG: serine/threonine protein kinase, partial [Myxococcales bacterium]|nr:serine/threonine protein kinase [Myxococcales bacterium]